MGLIVKNRARSVVAGIRERIEYEFSEEWYPHIAADVVSMLNRTARRGETLTPIQHFYPGHANLDVLRDLRPKKGVATSISVMKAEWGIVVSRTFNGSGVLKVYLLESRSYAHRFKFARPIILPHVMILVINLAALAEPLDIIPPVQEEEESAAEPPVPETTSLPPVMVAPPVEELGRHRPIA
jgi:hypothetical protein